MWLTHHAPGPAFVLLLLALALLAPQSVQAQIDDHLRCYKVKDPLKLKGFVDLDTAQFGLAPGCKITKAKLLCVPADKFNEDVFEKKTKSGLQGLTYRTNAAELGDYGR